MPFCGNCGTQVDDGKKFCTACGAPMGEQSGPSSQQTPPRGDQQQGQAGRGFEDFKNRASNAKDCTGEMDPSDIEKNTAMGGLAYFLFFLPLLVCPESKYGRFHANQGLILLLLCIAGGILNAVISAIFWFIPWLFFVRWILSLVIWLPILAVGVIGLVNGFSGKAKELPLIGHLRIIK